MPSCPLTGHVGQGCVGPCLQEENQGNFWSYNFLWEMMTYIASQIRYIVNQITYIVDQIDWMATKDQLLDECSVPMPRCYVKKIALVDIPPVNCERMFIEVALQGLQVSTPCPTRDNLILGYSDTLCGKRSSLVFKHSSLVLEHLSLVLGLPTCYKACHRSCRGVLSQVTLYGERGRCIICVHVIEVQVVD
jgi:hypothetical protein